MPVSPNCGVQKPTDMVLCILALSSAPYNPRVPVAMSQMGATVILELQGQNEKERATGGRDERGAVRSVRCDATCCSGKGADLDIEHRGRRVCTASACQRGLQLQSLLRTLLQLRESLHRERMRDHGLRGDPCHGCTEI